MKKINITYGKQIVLADDLNIFFDSNLEAKGGKPILKEKSVARMVELKEEYDLCDIWRIRNPLEKSFTFRQNYSSGILNCRLDFKEDLDSENSFDDHISKYAPKIIQK